MSDDVDQIFAARQMVDVGRDLRPSVHLGVCAPARQMRGHEHVLEFAERMLRRAEPLIYGRWSASPDIDRRCSEPTVGKGIEQCRLIDYTTPRHVHQDRGRWQQRKRFAIQQAVCFCRERDTDHEVVGVRQMLAEDGERHEVDSRRRVAGTIWVAGCDGDGHPQGIAQTDQFTCGLPAAEDEKPGPC